MNMAEYLERVGLDGSDLSLGTLHRAHVEHIPYENVDVRLGREIRLDLESLTAKLVRARRGGYCFEMNTLFAAVLEEAGFRVRRYLGRVRLGDPVSPRPATHMVLMVDDQVVDVGFGGAVPLGPVPLDGEATYGAYTWRTSRVTTPEGEEAWLMQLFDLPLFTFVEQPVHPIDYVTPNHFTSTHPLAIFTQFTIVQRWREDGVQVGLIDGELKERHPDGVDRDTAVDPADLGDVLADHFDLHLDPEELGALRDRHRR